MKISKEGRSTFMRWAQTFLTLWVLGGILCTCQMKSSTRVQSIPVTVEITVLHPAGQLSGRYIPTKGAWVILSNADGSPIDPRRIFRKATDDSGKVLFRETNNVLLPTFRYRIRVYFENSRTVTDYFQVPQYPNYGTEYYIRKTLYHKIGDSLYVAANQVLIQATVKEPDPQSGEWIPSENALVRILQEDGRPLYQGFSYEALTDSQGIAIIRGYDLYLIPGFPYLARAEKMPFRPTGLIFQVPRSPNWGEGYFIELELKFER